MNDSGMDDRTAVPPPSGRGASPAPLELILAGRRAAACTGAAGTPGDDRRRATSEQLDLLRVVICRENYGIDIMAIREVITPRRVTEIPWTPAHVLGVISLRGSMVPVLGMAQRLGMEVSQAGGRERVVVVRCSRGLVGLQVDQVGQIVRVARRNILPSCFPPDGRGGEFISGVVCLDDLRIGLLDVERVADLGDLISQDREWAM